MEKLTLNSRYILKEASKNRFTLFNTFLSKEYTISNTFYLFLKVFKHNLISLSDVVSFFEEKKIDLNINGVLTELGKIHFSDLLIKSEKVYTSLPQHKIPLANYPSYVNNTPTRVDLLLTERCNLKCLHCFQESAPSLDKDFPPLERLLSMFDEMEVLDIQTLKISGGELLVYPDSKKVLRALAKKRFKKSLLTNAILIDDEIIDIIKDSNFSLGISLDGSNIKHHEYLRGKNTFERTIRNISKLKDNNIKFSLTITLHRHNYYNLVDTVRLAHKIGARKININKINPLGRGAENDLSLTKEMVKQIKADTLILQQEFGTVFLDFIDTKELLKNELNDNLIYCTAGTCICAISPQLNVYPCTYGFHHDEYNMGSLYDNSLLEIWTNEKWRLFRGGVQLQDLTKCGSCGFNKKCMHKNCRLKPVSQGNSFYDAISYCKNGSDN